jgi:hypothetical protein
MTSRLFGIVATFWLMFTVFSLIVALAFSPMGLHLLIPDKHPITWVYPALIVVPPVLLASQNLLKPKAIRLILWPLAIMLTGFVMVLLLFLGSAFFGS